MSIGRTCERKWMIKVFGFFCIRCFLGSKIQIRKKLITFPEDGSFGDGFNIGLQLLRTARDSLRLGRHQEGISLGRFTVQYGCL